MDRKVHETQQSENIIIEQPSAYVDEQLKLIQQIESGGPPKRVNLQSLPRPIHYLGLCIVFGIPLLFLVLIVISLFK